MTTVYWITREGQPGRLGIMARPRGGDSLRDEMRELSTQGVELLVSTLTDWENEELDLEGQGSCCDSCAIEFWRFPIHDRSISTLQEGAEFLQRLKTKLAQNKAVVIHCRMGIGRSGMLSAAMLVLEGEDPLNAWDRVSHARETRVPDTEEQRQWLVRLADHLSAASE
jgi:protein-tyrosine phosphatase